jgi:hypothetical protein
VGRACGLYGREEKYLQGLVVKLGEKKPPRKPRLRGEDNITLKWILNN